MSFLIPCFPFAFFRSNGSQDFLAGPLQDDLPLGNRVVRDVGDVGEFFAGVYRGR